MVDFANILFSGRCNARCPFCIGRQVDPRLNVDNLGEYPPRNLARFVEMIRQQRARQVVLTGTNTDPQLYRHEGRLLAHLRGVLPAETRFSLHTNGRLALRKMEVFNRYDRVALSIPSFDPAIYRRVMGVSGAPDVAEILRQATVPIKISCVVTEDNQWGMTEFLAQCWRMGVGRLVLRKLVGDPRPWDELIELDDFSFRWEYRNNPVYDYQGMEVTLWDFCQSESRSINLFSSGVISTAYLLTEATEEKELVNQWR